MKKKKSLGAPGAEGGQLSLEARIYRVRARLTRSEQRLADVLLEHQMDLPLLTAAELAMKAGVSKSTAARLIQALGYQSYRDAKKAVRTEQFWGSPQAGLASAPEGDAGATAMMEADLENIRQTMAGISEQRLSEVAQRVAQARRVWIMGMRSGEGLAQHADHYLNLVRDEVQILNYGAGALSRSVAAVGAGDLLLVIAFRRRPKVLVRLLEVAREAGAETLLITDRTAGASARAATMALRCHTQSPAPFNSFAAAVTVINCLAWKVHAAMGESAKDRYRRIDSLVSEFDNVSTPARRD